MSIWVGLQIRVPHIVRHTYKKDPKRDPQFREPPTYFFEKDGVCKGFRALRFESKLLFFTGRGLSKRIKEE